MHRRLFELGFEIGCDMAFAVETDMLGPHSGVPELAKKQFPAVMPIALPAAFHGPNNPEISDDGILLTLSFDKLYRCAIPWAAIKQVVFHPIVSPNGAFEKPVPPEVEPPDDEEPMPENVFRLPKR